jgi:peptide/nickel transport system substrate-binding protein
MKFRGLIVFGLLLALLTGCGGGEGVMDGASTPEVGIAGPTATPTPVPVTLVVCLGDTPNTLFPFGAPNLAAQTVLQALYDQPVEQRSYAYQPVLVEGLPDIAGGTAVLQTVEVRTGDKVVDARGEVVTLEPGTFIRPAGCLSEECSEAFDGNQASMDQMTAVFVLRSGLTWSDGTPLTAEDSVYGFSLQADPATPASKYKTQRTLSYEAADERTIRWTGIPGFIDPEYQANFWLPAPRHVWSDLPVAELAVSESAAARPLGYGPFVLTESSVDRFTLVRNANYFRAGEGLPRLDQLVFRVVGLDVETNRQMLQTGECDLLDPQAAGAVRGREAEISELVDSGLAAASWANDDGWAVLNFGIVPQSYDDEYSIWAGDRPDFFGSVPVRQAIALCLDREATSAEMTGGVAPVMDSYIPPDHALFDPSVPVYRLDIESAADLLEEVGWVLNDEGLRIASEIEGINNGTLFSFELLYADFPDHARLTAMISEQLAECGIEAVPVAMPEAELFTTGAEGPIFGRNFDMAYFRWQSADQPPCYLYLSEAIPGPDEERFPYKWGGWNPTGWQDEEYDAACQAARGSAPGMESYARNHARLQQILAEQLPVIPLFTFQQAALARPEVCGLAMDPTAGMLWNIEELGTGELCP